MLQIRMTVINGPEDGFVLQAKENLQVDFVWSCEIFAQLCEMVPEVMVVVVAPLISHDHVKLVFFMQIGWTRAKWLFCC